MFEKNSKIDLSYLEMDSILRPIYRRGNRILRNFLFLYFLIGILFSSIYQTWYLGFVVGGTLTLSFLLTAFFNPSGFFSRAISGIVLQSFSFLFLFQLKGKLESEMFFLISFAVLIVYYDWKAFVPAGIFYVFLFSTYNLFDPFSLKLNHPQNEIIFTFILQLGISSLHILICAYWAYLLKKTTLRDSETMKLMDRYSEELGKTSNFLHTILDNIPYMVFVKGKEKLEFVIWNKAGEKMTGYSKEKILGKTDKDFFEHVYSEHFHNYDKEVIQSGQPVDIARETIPDKDGGTIYLHTKKIPIYEKDELKYILGISEDITERLIQEEELKKAKNAAEHLSKVKSEFLANMSHELRTPLNSILGFGQFLMMEEIGELNLRQREYIEYILQSGQLLLGLISEILDLSKIESGKFELSVAPISIKPVLEASIKTIEPLAIKKNINLSFEFPDHPIIVTLDTMRFKQIILNLLNNAIKFTEPGKQVGMEVVARNGNVFITVWDKGVGIAESEVQLVFEPFEQIGDKSKKVGGTGLGLSIAKRLVEIQNGTIKVESQLGKGSSFTIQLKILSTEEEKGHSTTTVPYSPSNSGAIFKRPFVFLIIEDDELSAQILQTALIMQNQECKVAGNWREAKIILQNEHIDIVLTDMHLPDMFGSDILEWINTNIPKLPVIAVTASVDKSLGNDYISKGFSGFIGKPVELKKFYKIVSDVINKTYE